MNKVILIGNIATDIELRTTLSGKPVAQFRLAVQRKFTNAQGEREADFLPIIVWNKTAEMCAQYLAKGRKIGITGSIQVRSYEKDGQKRYATEIIGDEVEFLDSRQTGTDAANPANAQAAASNTNNKTVATPPSSPTPNGFVDASEEELPF